VRDHHPLQLLLQGHEELGHATSTLITATLWNELVNDIIAQTAKGFSVVIDGGGAAIASDTFIDVGPIPMRDDDMTPSYKETM
jgi:hypothetical protein